MRVEFETTYDDCVVATLEATKRHPSYGHALFVWRWGLASATLVVTAWFVHDQVGLASLLVGLGTGALVAQVMPWVVERWVVTKIHGRLAHAAARTVELGKRQLELLPEGMKLSGPQFDVVYKWSAFQAIERRGPRILVFFAGVAGVAIPASAVDESAFIAEVERVRAGATGA
jgi:hypothetical protein